MTIRIIYPLFLLCAFVGIAKAQTENNAITLNEFTFVLKRPIIFSGDTINYTVDSFSSNRSATIEDILKRLPGIDVDANGKISMQGKAITKLFLNGKEYSASNLQVLSQNIPANVIDIIQVTDWYDENEKISGMKKGTEEKMLNLKFKDKYAKGLIDKFSVGFGNVQRYQVNNFINWMNGNSRITSIVDMNNTGRPNGLNGNALKNRSVPGLSKNKDLNINFSFEKNKKLKLSGTYEFEQKDNQTRRSLFRTTYLPGDSILLKNQYSEITSLTNHNRLNLRQTYKANNRTTFITELKVSCEETESSENASDTTAITESIPSFSRTSTSKERFSSTSIKLFNIVQKRFKKEGRVMLINFQGILDKNDRADTTNFDNRYYLPHSTSFNSSDKQEAANNLNTQFGIQYTEPIFGNSLLSIKWNYLYSETLPSDKS